MSARSGSPIGGMRESPETPVSCAADRCALNLLSSLLCRCGRSRASTACAVFFPAEPQSVWLCVGRAGVPAEAVCVTQRKQQRHGTANEGNSATKPIVATTTANFRQRPASHLQVHSNVIAVGGLQCTIKPQSTHLGKLVCGPRVQLVSQQVLVVAWCMSVVYDCDV